MRALGSVVVVVFAAVGVSCSGAGSGGPAGGSTGSSGGGQMRVEAPYLSMRLSRNAEGSSDPASVCPTGWTRVGTQQLGPYSPHTCMRPGEGAMTYPQGDCAAGFVDRGSYESINVCEDTRQGTVLMVYTNTERQGPGMVGEDGVCPAGTTSAGTAFGPLVWCVRPGRTVVSYLESNAQGTELSRDNGAAICPPGSAHRGYGYGTAVCERDGPGTVIYIDRTPAGVVGTEHAQGPSICPAGSTFIGRNGTSQDLLYACEFADTFNVLELHSNAQGNAWNPSGTNAGFCPAGFELAGGTPDNGVCIRALLQ